MSLCKSSVFLVPVWQERIPGCEPGSVLEYHLCHSLKISLSYAFFPSDPLLHCCALGTALSGEAGAVPFQASHSLSLIYAGTRGTGPHFLMLRERLKPSGIAGIKCPGFLGEKTNRRWVLVCTHREQLLALSSQQVSEL